jgi:hypothetical protein
MPLELRGQVRQLDLLPSTRRREAAPPPVESLATVVRVEKHVRRILQYGDLLPVSGRTQLRASREQEPLVLGRVLQALQEHAGRGSLQRRIRRVGQQQIVRSEELRHRLVERAGHRGAPPIRTYNRRYLGRCIASIDNGFDMLIEYGFEIDFDASFAHRKRARVAVGECDPHRSLARGEVGVVHLVPVVILGRGPENGENDHPQLVLERSREPDDGHRLVDGVERTGEESGLLPRRDHGATLLDEAGEARAGTIRGRPQRRGGAFTG